MKGVCFDMDGVLVMSEDHWVSVERGHILPTAAPGADIPLSAITGRNYRELYPELSARYDLAISREEFEGLFEAAAAEIYGEHATLLEGAHDLLADLRAAGVDLALTTSSPPEWISLVDDRFDILRHFDRVVSAADLDGPGKPAPDIYERGAAALGHRPDECVAVEDSEAGTQAAAAAGLWTVGFRAEGGDADLGVADVVVSDVAGLRRALFDRR